ncbi:MAG: 30S ribosomal protein S2 [Candidatus Sericytochromatia bacterium]|nr:MAG: 30S ribosomal protein S2 [Candidatus Sericytochromatia bacterium]
MEKKNKVYIINLKKTLTYLEKAHTFVKKMCSNETTIVLFVGTKKQAQDCIRDEALRANMFYVNHRWLGGMLTNFNTIKSRIAYLKDLEDKKNNGYFDNLNKKEIAQIEKEISKLNKSLGGIKEMNRLPDLLYVVDTEKEHLAVTEARKLNIPIVAMVDTNCNPDLVDFPIPSNDDSMKAIKLITSKIADAIIEGKNNKTLEQTKEDDNQELEKEEATV